MKHLYLVCILLVGGLLLMGCVGEKPFWANKPVLQCNVASLPPDFNFRCSSFESFDELHVLTKTQITLNQFEFVEYPNTLLSQDLNQLGWQKLDSRFDGWTEYYTRTVGLAGANGKYALKINDEYLLAFEIVSSD